MSHHSSGSPDYSAVLNNLVSGEVQDELQLQVLDRPENPLAFAEGNWKGETLQICHHPMNPRDYQVCWAGRRVIVSTPCAVEGSLRLLMTTISAEQVTESWSS